MKARYIAMMVVSAFLGVLLMGAGAYAQTTTATAIESSTALLAQISLFLGAVGGIIGVIIPYLKGRQREIAEKVASYVDQTDRWVLPIEAQLKAKSTQIELLEGMVANAVLTTPEMKAQYEEYKKKVIEVNQKATEEIAAGTAELEKGRQALSELLK